jgi:hypothetical protein
VVEEPPPGWEACVWLLVAGGLADCVLDDWPVCVWLDAGLVWFDGDVVWARLVEVLDDGV